MQETGVLLGADLNTDGNELVGVFYPVGECVGGQFDFIQVGLVFMEAVVPSVETLSHLAVKIHILGVQPIDFEVA